MAQTEDSTQTDKTNALCPLRTKEMNHEISREVAPEYYGSQSYGVNKPWFDEECLGFLDQRKRAKMHWIQDPNQSNVDILNNVRREVSRHFRDKKKAYLRAKLRNLKLTVRSKTLGTSIGASMTLGRVTNLDIIQ